MSAYKIHITDAQQVLTDEEILALIPESIFFLSQLIGIEHTLAIISEYGGTTIVFPRKHAISLNHRLCDILGLKIFEAVCAQLGGTPIEIPVATALTTQMRHRIIKEAAKRSSNQKLARRFNLTVRQIRSIVNAKDEIKSKRDDRQQDMFCGQ